MKVAVMQPYIFPYLGYFQLVDAADTFVFCDDVNFIKGGWIHRNRILLRNTPYFISFPIVKASQNKLIKELEIKVDSKEFSKILPTIHQAYNKAPYFNDVFPILENVLNQKTKNLAEFASKTVISISDYLGLRTAFMYSSLKFAHTKGEEKSLRLVNICKELESKQYINPIGGQEIYDKKFFNENEMTLNFLESQIPSYNQFNNDFVANLSIIDVIMFNSIEETNVLLNKYRLL